jgi:hypothetical protein
MVAQDFLLDANYDLLITNGDFVIGASDNQNIQDIIQSYVGWWKQYPLVGVGIQSFINSNGQDQALARSIQIQLQSDGFTVQSPQVTINPDQVIIQPNAVRQ